MKPRFQQDPSKTVSLILLFNKYMNFLITHDCDIMQATSLLKMYALFLQPPKLLHTVQIYIFLRIHVGLRFCVNYE